MFGTHPVILKKKGPSSKFKAHMAIFLNEILSPMLEFHMILFELKPNPTLMILDLNESKPKSNGPRIRFYDECPSLKLTIHLANGSKCTQCKDLDHVLR